MNTRKEITVVTLTLLSGTFVIIFMSFITLIIYAVFISPTGRDILLRGTILMLLIGGLSFLIGLNLIYFSVKMRIARPNLARGLPAAFSVVTLFLLMFLPIFNLYSVNAKGVVLYFLFSAITFTLLSSIIYFKNSNLHQTNNNQ